MIAITGATGHLGQLTIQALLDQGTAPQEIAALVRSPEKAADLAAAGVQVRAADYTRPETLGPALQGIDKLLLISSNDMNDRAGQHRNVIEAARQAGVKLIAYTSILKADTSGLGLAADHKATEDLIRASGIPFVFLRNGWYLENYDLKSALERGALVGAAGEGRFNPAGRADYAAAAAAALTRPDMDNKVFELGGDQAITLGEMAAELQSQGGRPVAYHDMPAEAYGQMLEGVGLPAPVAQMLADSDRGLAQGELATDRHDLSELIGHPTTTLAQAVTAALKG